MKDEPKTDEVTKMQQKMEPNIDQQPSQQDLDEFPDNNNSLPDPFSQVNADMSELISDEEDKPHKKLTFKKPTAKKP